MIRRTVDAPPERVFAAWTRPEIVRRWFAPGPMTVEEAEIDPRPGGSYRVVMRSPQGAVHSPSGVYEEFVPGEKLVFTWRWAESELETRVSVLLSPAASGGTELELVHEGFPAAAMRDEHQEGWAGCLEKLPAAMALAAAESGW